MECIFCKIVNGEIETFKIYEDEYYLVVLDINPASKGHSLIISKKHNEIGDNLGDIIKKLLKNKNKLNFKDYVLLKKTNKEQFDHFVINFIPIYEDKEIVYQINNKTGNIEELKKLSEELKIKEEILVVKNTHKENNKKEEKVDYKPWYLKP